MQTLIIVCVVLGIIFSYLAIHFLFNFSLFQTIRNIASEFLGKTTTVVNSVSKKSQKKLDRTNSSQRKKTLAYFYKTIVNDILLDMGWKQMGVTVEGLTIMAICLTAIVSLAGFALLHSLFMFILGAILMYCLIIAVLFSISRSQHRTRKAILIATEDMLCSNMSFGLVKAVEKNIEQMDIEVKPDFQKFLDDMDNRMDIELAIDRLNERLGSKFDNFCEKAKVMSTNYKQGYEDSFQFNIEDNAIESRLDAEIEECFFDLNTDYFATLSLLVVFFFIMNGAMGNMAAFYLKTTAGKLLLFGYVAIAAAVFVFTQVIQSKKF